MGGGGREGERKIERQRERGREQREMRENIARKGGMGVNTVRAAETLQKCTFI